MNAHQKPTVLAPIGCEVPDWVPPHPKVLVQLQTLGDELMTWNAEAFDGDGEVSGADAVEFLCEHRDRLRHVLAEYRAADEERRP